MIEQLTDSAEHTRHAWCCYDGNLWRYGPNGWQILGTNHVWYEHDPLPEYGPYQQIEDALPVNRAMQAVRELADKMLGEHGQSWNSISGRRILDAIAGAAS